MSCTTALENTSHCFWSWGVCLTWVQTHELAAFLRVLAVLLTSLGPLTQGSNAHLRLPSMAGTAQTWVISLGSEVEPFIHHIVFDINTRLTCKGHICMNICVFSSTAPRFPTITLNLWGKQGYCGAGQDFSASPPCMACYGSEAVTTQQLDKAQLAMTNRGH